MWCRAFLYGRSMAHGGGAARAPLRDPCRIPIHIVSTKRWYINNRLERAPRALLSRARHLDHASRGVSPWARPHYSACGFPRAQRPRTLANAPGTPRPTSHESPMDLNPLNGSGMRLTFKPTARPAVRVPARQRHVADPLTLTPRPHPRQRSPPAP